MLREAKSLIDAPERWIKGRLKQYRKDGTVCAYCLVGAISSIACNHGLYWANYDAMAASLRACFIVGESLGLAEWNDEYMRTHDEVMLAFDNAIAHEELQ